MNVHWRILYRISSMLLFFWCGVFPQSSISCRPFHRRRTPQSRHFLENHHAVKNLHHNCWSKLLPLGPYVSGGSSASFLVIEYVGKSPDVHKSVCLTIASPHPKVSTLRIFTTDFVQFFVIVGPFWRFNQILRTRISWASGLFCVSWQGSLLSGLKNANAKRRVFLNAEGAERKPWPQEKPLKGKK